MVLKFSCKCFGGIFFEGWGNFGSNYRTSYIYCFSSEKKIGWLNVIFSTVSFVMFVN